MTLKNTNKEMKDLLKKISELQGLAIERATDLHYANGGNYIFDSIKFYEDYITVRFVEDYDWHPDYDSIELTLSDLEMSDKDWKDHIESIKSERLRAEEEKKKEIERKEYEKKLREFERLRSELGK